MIDVPRQLPLHAVWKRGRRPFNVAAARSFAEMNPPKWPVNPSEDFRNHLDPLEREQTGAAYDEGLSLYICACNGLPPFHP